MARFQKKVADAPVPEPVQANGVVGAVVSMGMGLYNLRMGMLADNPVAPILQDVFGTIPTEMTPRSSRIEDGHLVVVCEVRRAGDVGNVVFELVVIPGAFIVQNARGVAAVQPAPSVESPDPVEDVPAPVPVDMTDRKHAEMEDGEESSELKFD